MTNMFKEKEYQVNQKSKMTLSNIKMKIPSTCPSLLDTCSLIKNNYLLQVNFTIKGINEPVRIEFPIRIGTIPFLETGSNLSNELSYLVSSHDLEQKFKLVRLKSENDSIVFVDHNPLYPNLKI